MQQYDYGILYFEINIFSLLLISIILYKTRGLSKMMAQRNFVLSIISEMIFFISDTLCVLIASGVMPGNGTAIMIFKTIYFFSTATMCFFWFLYFEYLRETSLVKKKRKISLASSVIWLMAILLFGNIFGKYLFYIDDTGVYRRGSLFILIYVLAYSYVIISCVRIIADIKSNNSKIDRGYLIVLAMFPVAPGISGIMQFINPRYPVACVAMSLTTLILYLYWIDQLISLDPLTGLSNRKQLLLSFEQWKKNKLKQKINEILAEIVKKEELPFELTVSIGIASFDEKDELKDLISRADRSMYEDKNTRR